MAIATNILLVLVIYCLLLIRKTLKKYGEQQIVRLRDLGNLMEYQQSELEMAVRYLRDINNSTYDYINKENKQ